MFVTHLKTLFGALAVGALVSACRTSEGDSGAEGRSLPEGQPAPSCVVAKTSLFQVTGKDVARVRSAMFPPPGWDESVRLTTAAAVASTLPKGQPKEASDTRGVSVDPWLAAYERLTRLVKLEGGGDPAGVARRLDTMLSARFVELRGEAGACGGALRGMKWVSER